jgi:hypothetical protein
LTISHVTHNPDSLVSYFFMNEIEAPVYAWYSQPSVDGGICDSTLTGQCAFSNLTMNQWLHGSVLLYPLPELETPSSFSYVYFYAGYSMLQYPPEVYYFAAINGNDFPAEVTVFDAYQGFNSTGLFNPKIIQDIWLDYMDPNWANTFTSPYSLYYIRYVTLNLGMGGLFMPLTPSAAFNGYTNPFLEKMQSLPVYMGGSVSPLPEAFAGVVNIDPVGFFVTTKPPGATYLFYPGSAENPSQTRQIASWAGYDVAKVEVEEYLNLVST